MSFKSKWFQQYTEIFADPDYFEFVSTFNASAAAADWSLDILVSNGTVLSENQLASTGATAAQAYTNLIGGAITGLRVLNHASYARKDIGGGSITMTAAPTPTAAGSATTSDPMRIKYSLSPSTFTWSSLSADNTAGWTPRYILLSHNHPNAAIGRYPVYASDEGDVVGKILTGDDFTIDVPILLENLSVSI